MFIEKVVWQHDKSNPAVKLSVCDIHLWVSWVHEFTTRDLISIEFKFFLDNIYIRFFSYLFAPACSLQRVQTHFYLLDKWILFPTAFLWTVVIKYGQKRNEWWKYWVIWVSKVSKFLCLKLNHLSFLDWRMLLPPTLWNAAHQMWEQKEILYIAGNSSYNTATVITWDQL